VSFDMIFGRLLPGQTWAQYRFDDDRDRDTEAAELDAATWARIVTAAREFLPHLQDLGGALKDDQSGIQLSCSVDTGEAHAPYWYAGDDARSAVSTVYRLAAVIEAETDLRGYDPQLELPTQDACGDGGRWSVDGTAGADSGDVPSL
jgi:hypothetical protein